MEKPSDNSSQSTELEPFISQESTLVPKGFQMQVSTHKARMDEQTISRERTGSFSGSYSRAKKIESSIQDIERFDKEQALLSGSENALMVLQTDPLEEYRKQAGLSEERDKLLHELSESYSFDWGLRLLTLASDRKERYLTMEEVNADFPNLTKSEVTLFSLLERFPNYMIGKFPGSNDTDILDLKRASIAFVGGVTINGIEVRLDLNNQTDQDRSDVYVNKGMTGKNDGEFSEDVDFEPEVKEIFSNLIALTVTNQRLFERIWDTFDVSLLDGFVKMDKMAVENVLARELTTSEKIAEVISRLSSDEKVLVNNEKAILDEALGKNIVVNPLKRQIYAPQDLVRLIGLMQETPDIFFHDEPFEGYMIPYGTGLLFTDQNGNKNYYPFHDHYIREELRGLYYESVDATKYNHVMSQLFTDVRLDIQRDIQQEMEEDGVDPSLLEGMQLDAKLRYNLDFNSDEGQLIRENTSLFEGSDKYSRETPVKIGVDEINQIIAAVRLVPQEFLSNIKGFQKRIDSLVSMQQLISGAVEAANYNFFTKTITMKQPPYYPFNAKTPEDRAVYVFTVLHEIAHGVMRDFDMKMYFEWDAISHAQGITQTPESTEYLTTYARESKQEDFAEHLASYVFHGEEFRNKAESDSTLKLKYEFMKKVFEKIGGNVREYPQISPFSFEQLHVYGEEFAKKMELADAAEKLKKMEEESEVAMRKKSEQVFSRDEGNESHDVLLPEETEAAIDERDVTIEDRINLEKQIGYKRNAIENFIDYLAADFSQEEAERRARKLYQLLEDDEYEDAIVYAKRFMGEDYWDEIEDRITQIYEDISSGNDFVRY